LLERGPAVPPRDPLESRPPQELSLAGAIIGRRTDGAGARWNRETLGRWAPARRPGQAVLARRRRAHPAGPDALVRPSMRCEAARGGAGAARGRNDRPCWRPAPPRAARRRPSPERAAAGRPAAAPEPGQALALRSSPSPMPRRGRVPLRRA